MADKQYGLPAEEIQALKEQAALRLKNREYFLKQVHNPFRKAVQEGGHLFDPAIMRYHAMTEAHLQFFKPTPKTTMIGLLLTFGAMGSYSYMLYLERESRFKKIRAGQVAYYDRPFKLI